MLSFTQDFPTKYACACHQLVKRGYSIRAYESNALDLKGDTYTFLPPAARIKADPIFCIVEGMMRPPLYKPANIVVSRMFNVDNEVVGVFRAYMVGSTRDTNTEQKTFARHLAWYFLSRIYGKPSWCDIELLQRHNTRFDFDGFQFARKDMVIR